MRSNCARPSIQISRRISKRSAEVAETFADIVHRGVCVCLAVLFRDFYNYIIYRYYQILNYSNDRFFTNVISTYTIGRPCMFILSIIFTSYLSSWGCNRQTRRKDPTHWGDKGWFGTHACQETRWSLWTMKRTMHTRKLKTNSGDETTSFNPTEEPPPEKKQH